MPDKPLRRGTLPMEVKTGDRYGHLKIIREATAYYYGKYRHRVFLCKCVCGKEKKVRLEFLRNGHTKSCGCLRNRPANNRTHGETNTRLYRTWAGMKRRCFNKKVKSYKHYGERGITVCKEWIDYIPFRTWALKNGYKDHLTIERIDNNGNYSPENCTWIPKSEQGKNSRLARGVKIGDLFFSTIKEAAKYFRINRNTVDSRMNRGLTLEQALTWKKYKRYAN